MIYLAILLAFVPITWLAFKRHKEEASKEIYYNDKEDWYSILSWGLLICGFIYFFVVGGIIMNKHIATETEVAQYDARREVLIEQYEYLKSINDSENLFYNESDVYGDIFTDIKNYNNDIINKRGKVGNFWVGIMHPKEYLELKTINLNTE